jgi:purine nucleosidase
MRKAVVGGVLLVVSSLMFRVLAVYRREGVKLTQQAQARQQSAAERRSPVPSVTPILLDTDIGTDIDDAFALALIIRSPELDLAGVTTVSGDTQARARIAARMLTEAAMAIVPVVPGEPGIPRPLDQGKWAEGFKSPQIWKKPAVDFLQEAIDKTPGKITLVAIGPLTNVAQLITHSPEKAHKLKRIVLMGGSIAHGYGTDPKPAAEYNIKSDVKAAQTVFSSGIPILMIPLDVTARHELNSEAQNRVFTHLTALTNSLALLYHLWGGKTPVLYDPVAVAMVIKPDLCVTRKLAIRVDSQGFTRVDSGKAPNAEVALETDKKVFFDFYLSRVAP